jgi:hypothetical protein
MSLSTAERMICDSTRYACRMREALSPLLIVSE